jgi:UDP-N-acetylmuramate--alanine ligase
MPLKAGAHVHFVGIGGFGLSAIAQVMLEQGFTVSGCDLEESSLAKKLGEKEVKVSVGHDPAHLDAKTKPGKPDALVVSSAVPDDNPELEAARKADIPIYKRADILGELMADRQGVAIAGTHGKTTTTAMTAYVLSQAGLDPTYIVGGVLHNTSTNAHAGRGKPFVVEADEYDRMFMGLKPSIAIVTSVEHDHPDKFPGLHDVRAAFDDFVDLLPDDGLLIACYDDPQARLLADRRRKAALPAMTYGLAHGADLRAMEVITTKEGGSDFIVKQGLAMKGMVRLRLAGTHNVQNCLAVLALSEHLGVQCELVAALISEFRGGERRFENKGRVAGVTVIDDYAHHPTAVRLTLKSARTQFGSRPIWAIFQPHTYTRTKTLLDDFAAAFEDADHVLVTDIYRSRETDNLGISSGDLIKKMDHPDAQHIGELDRIVRYLAGAVEPGDVVITMSAGDATRVGDDLLKALKVRAEVQDAIGPDELTELRDEFLEELASREQSGKMTRGETETWRKFVDEATLTPGLMKRLLARLHQGEAAGGKPEFDG